MSDTFNVKVSLEITQDVTDPNRYTKTLLEARFERRGLETFTAALSQLHEFAAASSGIHTLVTQTEAPK